MDNNAIMQLGKELAALKEFVVLLTKEQKSLLCNDTDTLLTLSEVKTQASSQLMELSNTRRKSLLANSRDTMEKWLAKYAPSGQKIWNEIQKLAAQAQNLNSTNGELIQSRMRNNQQALGVLYNSTTSTAGLYGPNGQTNLGGAGRHLGSG